MLDSHRLAVFRAVARHGSFSAAGRELGYTQPAISHHVDALETELGAGLVVRTGHGIQLTEAGRVLADHADEVLTRMAAAEDEVAAIAGLRAGRVRLAAFPSASATLIPKALAILRAQHPGLGISFVEAEPTESLPLLRSGELDVVVGFSYAEEVPIPFAHERTPLLEDPLLAVLPADHRLAGRQRVRLDQLAEETWIAGCEQCRGHLLYLCDLAGFAPQIEFATDDNATVQAMVSAGLGVAVLPRLALAELRRADIAIRPITGTPSRTIEVIVLGGGRQPTAVAAMVSVLREVAGTARESGYN